MLKLVPKMLIFLSTLQSSEDISYTNKIQSCNCES